MIEVKQTGLDGVVEILPRRIEDSRGFFSETYNRAAFEAAGISIDFVQDNFSLSRGKGVLRGLHYQLPPQPQVKLVRVARGAIFDVAVDICRSSPTFRKWIGVILSAERWNQLLIPAGFAHGFVTLEPDTEVAYKTSGFYSAAHDRAIRFDDPEIAVEWPIDVSGVTLSDKDRKAPLLRDAEIFD